MSWWIATYRTCRSKSQSLPVGRINQSLLTQGIQFWLEHPLLVPSTASIFGSASQRPNVAPHPFLASPASIHFWLPILNSSYLIRRNHLIASCRFQGLLRQRPLRESNKINLLVSGSTSTGEIILALFRWDKDQRPFGGSPASLKSFACASGGRCLSVDWYFPFPFLCLPRALRFRRCYRACCCSFTLLDTIPVSFF